MSRIVTGVADAQQQGARSKQSWGLMREFAASGISVGCANTILNPVEVIKTRMQLSGAASAATLTKPCTAALRPEVSFAAAARTAAGQGSSASTAHLLPNATSWFSPRAAYRVGTGATAAKHPSAPVARAAASQAFAPLPEPVGPVVTAVGSTKAAASATRSVERSVAASLDAAAAAMTHPSSSSRPVHVESTARHSCSSTRAGFFSTARLILQEEGPMAFGRGIQASASRAVLNGGIRLGLYDPIKTLMSADGTGRDLHMGQKLVAGSISGGIGAVLTTPIELAKTRLQAPGATTTSMSAVLKGVIQQQGVAGLWRGATPSVLRLILLNSSMVATYDEVKGHIRTLTGWSSGIQLVLSSSMVAGLVTTTVINPADVARAYMQTGRGDSLLGVARGILAREGPRGFFKGWTAAYARTGPQTLIIFTVSELVRPLFGLNVIGGSA